MPQELTLHHVGYVATEISPAARSFCERLGYRTCTPVIHDPHQTALVQFLSLPTPSPCIEIVAPDTPASRLTGAAKRGGLHHLCFLAGSLEPEIARMRELGMLLIAEPAPAVAFAGRRICWLGGGPTGLIELVERRNHHRPLQPRPERLKAVSHHLAKRLHRFIARLYYFCITRLGLRV